MPTHSNAALGVAALAVALLAGCGGDGATVAPTALLAARGTDRPFAGSCSVVLATRVHDEEEGGGCGGGHEGEEGGPPIPRHFDVSGSCQLSHLGRAQVSGRLNLSGPLGAGHGEEEATEGEGGHGQLMARGRLLFTAADGDQLAGRYVPVSAVFTKGTDGGTLVFTATEQFGESCSGQGGGGGGHEGEPGHEQPESSGRFADAIGSATITGSFRIMSSGQGSGRLVFSGGRLSY